jgi:hypothetical protein
MAWKELYNKRMSVMFDETNWELLHKAAAARPDGNVSAVLRDIVSNAFAAEKKKELRA